MLDLALIGGQKNIWENADMKRGMIAKEARDGPNAI
jgi:hypothetical protein